MFRIFRDTAYSLKHGRLSRGTRLVSGADAVGTDGTIFEEFIFDHDAFEGEVVFIEIHGRPRERAEFVVNYAARKARMLAGLPV
jgi:hypothetical protein